MLQRFEAFVAGITVCYRYIQRIKSVEMTELGLKGTHVMCLFYLHRSQQPLTATQLCQLCAEDKAAISRTLMTLQEKGYIQTGEKRYRSPITLTPAGSNVACQVDDLIAQWVGFGGDGLTEEERSIFYKALAHISENLQKKFESNSQP